MVSRAASHHIHDIKGCNPSWYLISRPASYMNTWYPGQLLKLVYDILSFWSAGTSYPGLISIWLQHIHACLPYGHMKSKSISHPWRYKLIVRPVHDFHACLPGMFIISRIAPKGFMQYRDLLPLRSQPIHDCLSLSTWYPKLLLTWVHDIPALLVRGLQKLRTDS